MAGGFGLLHGLGFAGALREAGLPQGEIPLALLSFNVGIELGQLAFVLGAGVLGAVLSATSDMAATLSSPSSGPVGGRNDLVTGRSSASTE